MLKQGLLRIIVLIVLSGCTPAFVPGKSLQPSLLRILDEKSRIKHVVVIVQQGRTFENLFAGWPHADAPLTGLVHTGRIIKLQQIRYSDDRPINDSYQNAKLAWDGGAMNDFDLNEFTDSKGGPARTYPYSYLDSKEIAP